MLKVDVRANGSKLYQIASESEQMKRGHLAQIRKERKERKENMDNMLTTLRSLRLGENHWRIHCLCVPVPRCENEIGPAATTLPKSDAFAQMGM